MWRPGPAPAGLCRPLPDEQTLAVTSDSDSLSDVVAPVPSAKGTPRRSRYSRLRQRQIVAMHVAWSKKRPFLVMPFVVLMLGLLALAGYPPERICILAIMSVSVMGMVLYEAFTVDPSDRETRHPRFLLLGYVSMQGLAIGVTGGLTSPLVCLMLGASVAEAMLRGRSKDTAIAIAANALCILALAVLPRSWMGPPIQAPFDYILTTITLLYSLFMSGALVASLTEAATMAGERLERMREDLLNSSLERTSSLEAVSAKVAHELKNPLAAVKALVQLLSSNAQDERSRQRLEVVRSEIARMEQIMSEYLSFSRPLQDLRPEAIDLAELADNVMAVLEARASDAGVTLSRTGGPANVVADPRRLKEALLNLVSNAIEATPGGGRVELLVQPRPGEAEVVVRDDGKGIPAEYLARVGTPFFTMREGGTGLGVLLAKTVVAQHGGQLTFDSLEGRGTSVTLRLPLEPPRASDQSLADVSAVVPAARGP